MGREPTVLVRMFLLLLEDAEHVGHARGPLARQVGVDLAHLKDPDARLPLRRMIALARAVYERNNDDGAGVRAGARRALRDGGLIGYTMLHSATVGEALAKLSRYTHIVSDAEEIVVRVRGDSATIGFDAHPLRRAVPALTERMAAWVVGAVRELGGASVVPLEVKFPHASPQDVGAHRAWFRCPLTFRARRCEIVLEAGVLERPIGSADPTLAGYLDRLAEQALRKLGAGESVADRVRRAVWSDLAGGPPSLRLAAVRLGHSPRTLQRRLAEEGASFDAIVTRLRRDLAPRLLAQRGLAVYEVAFMLGYAQASQFNRAFRQWYRMTPRTFRARKV